MNHALNIDKAINQHKQAETNEVEDISQNNPTQGIEIESGEFGVQDIHEEIIDDTQKISEENVEQVNYYELSSILCFIYYEMNNNLIKSYHY